MKTKLTYIAEDGTSFDTEKECIEYEAKLTNKYVVCYKIKEATFKRELYNESLAKRCIANLLHDCYEDKIIGNFKLIHCGKTVEFNSDELSNFVPAHYNIDGEKFDEIFQLSATKEVKIPGYTLHGDYYLADKVIPNKSWKEACDLRNFVILPNGKIVIAHTLSKEELETIPEEERVMEHNWYWTSTPYDDYDAWIVRDNGDFNVGYITISGDNGGARLGFKNPFIES